MVKINPEIVSWLEKGDLEEALLGRGAYFLPDSTYRDQHNILLVVYVMIMWAVETNKLAHCADEFFNAVREISDENLVKGLEILLAYLITSKDLKKTLPLNLDMLVEYLNNELDKFLISSQTKKEDAIKLFNEIKKRL